MIRTGDQYRASIRDDREVYIDGARVKDVTHIIRCRTGSTNSTL